MHQRTPHRDRLLTSRRPLPDHDVTSADGAWLHCADGRRLFDGSSGLICANVGRGSKRVLARIEQQFPISSFGGPAAIRPRPQLELTDRLCRAVGRPDDSVALVTCGTLGVEIAITLARTAVRARNGGNRADILTSTLSYHGMSALTLALAGNHRRRPRPEDTFGLGPAFPAPYPPVHQHPGSCDSGCADEVAVAIDARGACNVAAVLLEPVNGTTGGAYVPPDGYLRRVSQICAERGVLVIHDEVLTGLWRTGTPLASDHWPGARPDICVLSKGLGAGYTSVAAVLVSPAVAALLSRPDADPMPAMGTMAAHPLQAAACLGVLDELQSMDLTALHARAGHLGTSLHALAGLPVVRDVRGIGHLYAVELEPGTLWPAMEAAEKQGVLLYPFTGTDSPRSEGLVIAPPLTSTDEDMDFLATALKNALTPLKRP